jgi:hypothetical protein
LEEEQEITSLAENLEEIAKLKRFLTFAPIIDLELKKENLKLLKNMA